MNRRHEVTNGAPLAEGQRAWDDWERLVTGALPLRRTRATFDRIVVSPTANSARALSFADLVIVRRGVSLASLVSCLILAAAPAAHGQLARGVVTREANGAPLAGVLVVLLDSAGSPLTSALSDSTGTATLRAPRDGGYRLRVERVGQPDVLSPLLAVRATGLVTHRFALRDGPAGQRLRAVRIETAQRCERRPRDGAAAADLWNEARKALAATALGEASGTLVYRLRRSTNVLDPATLEPLRDEETWESETEADVPFRSAPIDSLMARGFVWSLADGSADYHGPDAATLLSDQFLDRHCLRARAADRDHRGQLGLAIEPVDNGSLPDISGTLWLDEQTSRLRTFEYRYVNLRLGVSLEHVGGRIEFDQTPDGRWIVRRWRIRTPVRVRPAQGPRAGEVVLAGIQERGAEVRSVRAAGTGVVRFGSLTGVVFDSVGMRPLARAIVSLSGARLETVADARGVFRIDSIPPGAYDAVAWHPRVDSLLMPAATSRVSISSGAQSRVTITTATWSALTAAHCHNAPRSDTTGIALGVVRDAAGRPRANVAVTALWTVGGSRAGQAVLTDMVAETVTAENGTYAFCALPVARTAVLHAGVVGRGGVTVRADSIPQRVDLALVADVEPRAAIANGASMITRLVFVTDSAGEPLRATEIQETRSNVVSATSDAGVGRVVGERGSETVVRIRRLGFMPQLVRVEFSSADTLPVRVVLRPVPVRIMGMTITGEQPISGRTAAFADRRRLGFAPSSRYVTRADIERRNPGRLVDMIASIPGFVVDAAGRVTSARGAVSLLLPCNVQIYVDGVAYDDQSMLGLLQPHAVEAIEAYHASEIPSEYNRTGTACGVILIWTR